MTKSDKKNKNNISDVPPYEKKRNILQPQKRKFYRNVKRILPKGHDIFVKLKFSDVIEVVGDDIYRKAFSKIEEHSIDFLFCDSDLRPYLIVQLRAEDEHETPERKSQLKSKVCALAKIPLLRYDIESSWDLSDISKYAKQAQKASK